VEDTGFMLEAISVDFECIEFARAELLTDRRFMLQALKHGDALSRAPNEFQPHLKRTLEDLVW